MENKSPNTINLDFTAIANIHSSDYLEFLRHLGIIQTKALRPLFFEYDLDLVKDEQQKPVFIAGIGRMFSFDGNFIAAKEYLDQAIYRANIVNAENNHPEKDDNLAYVYCEASVFYVKIFEPDISLNYLKTAQKFASNVNLKLWIDYLIEQHNIESQKQPDLLALEELVNKFNTHRMTILYVLELHRLGVLYLSKFKNFAKSKEFTEIAFDIANEYGYNYLSGIIELSFIKLYAAQGMDDKALELCEANIENTQSSFLKTLFLEKIAAINYKKQDYKLAADNGFKALDNSLNNKVFSQVHKQCLFLGRVYSEKLGQLEKATYFYKMGHDQAIKHAQMGLPLTGTRLTAINKYVEFLSRQTKGDAKVQVPAQIFDFTIGKTWLEIKNLFYYNLLIFYKKRSKRGRDLSKIVGLKRTTYYAYHQRLKKIGFKLPDYRKKNVNIDSEINQEFIIEPLQGYFQNLKHDKWKDITNQFENDLFLFLYKKHGYKKTNISRAISLNYQVVRQKTTHIVHEARMK